MPQPASEALDQAKALHQLGKYAEAETLLRRAIADDPRNGALRNARGVMFAAMEQNLDALWCYRDALSCDPGAAGTWTNLGNALTQLKSPASAAACHRQAIELSAGNDPLLYHNLGVSLAEAGQHAEAIVAFSRALDLRPDHYMARWNRARSYLYLGNYRSGWQDYEVRLIPGSSPTSAVPARNGMAGRFRENAWFFWWSRASGTRFGPPGILRA